LQAHQGVFSFTLPLALGVLSPLLPAAFVASDATVAVCFAPEEDCDAFAVRAIDGAEREILVSAYRLTVGSGIVGALIRAKEREVDVRVLADREAPCGRASGIDPLVAAGVPIWIDDRARIAHAKTMVIDGAVTLQGSYNWTRGAAANSEDLNLISSPGVAAAYAGHWRQRLGVSVPFVQREDWCRYSSGEAP
jgi:phosphatidylserine/phosphatidylglycerophosphate/cardiolipin synthase-like enzyme